MNRYILRAFDYWQKSQLDSAIKQCKKAIDTEDLLGYEQNVAYYVLTYLNCLLARRRIKAEAFLGVDLRTPYHDYYYEAAKYQQNIEYGFKPAKYHLPELDVNDLQEMELAWQYVNHLSIASNESWYARTIDAINHYVKYANGLIHKVL